MIFTARFFVVSEQPRSEEQKKQITKTYAKLGEAKFRLPATAWGTRNAETNCRNELPKRIAETNCRNELPKRRAGCLHHKYSDMVELDPLVAVDRATGFPGVLPRPESEIMHKQRRGLQPGIAQESMCDMTERY
jgi:hypothetical protein